MERIEKSIVINRPVAEVFAFTDNAANEPLWNGWITGCEQASAGARGVGTTLRCSAKFMGKTMEWTLEIIENEPDVRSAVAIRTGPMKGGIGRRLYEPVGAGQATTFTQILEGELQTFFEIAEPVVRRAFARQLDADLATLKDLMESNS